MPDSLAIVAYVIAVIAIEVHQVDAGAEAEWAVLGLPGRRATFLLFQGVIVAVMATGLVLLARGERAGDVIGALVGAGAVLGTALHAWIWRGGDPAFRGPESVAAIALMGAAGAVAMVAFTWRLAGG
jgi:hypothetical protein